MPINTGKSGGWFLKGNGLRARDFIFLTILIYGRNGISGKDLEYNSGLSRQTINQERTVLKKQELIEYNTKGKRTTYFPTKKALEEEYFRSWLYGKELFNKLGDIGLLFLDSPFYETKFSPIQNKAEKLFFQFSLRLGSILTYVFMQAMNPALINDLSFGKGSSKEVKTQLLNQWLKNVIDPMRMLIILRQSLYSIGYQFKVHNSKKPGIYSFYELENESFKDLSEAFARLFPDLHRELENVGINLSKSIDHYKKGSERAKCNHEYNVAEIKKDDSRYFMCSKCGHKITVHPSEIVKDREIVDKLNNMKPPKINYHCSKFGHQWQNRTGYEIDCLRYVCPLCGEGVTLNTNSIEEMEIMEEEVSINLGVKNVGLCKEIQYFFHYNNKELTIEDFIRFFKERRTSTLIVDSKSFVDTALAILGILVKHGYVKLQTHHRDPLKCVYKREYKIH